MDLKSRIARIDAVRNENGLSIHQLSDMCNISKSTISRVLAGKNEPKEYTICAMEEALGITDQPVGELIRERAESDPFLEAYLNMQEMRIKRLRAHYTMLLAEKNRWIMLLFILSLILVIFICSILVFDALHPDIGWIRQQLGLGFGKFKDILRATGDLISNFCLNIV